MASFKNHVQTASLIQGGSNMTGTDFCLNKPHMSRSYLNHPVIPSSMVNICSPPPNMNKQQGARRVISVWRPQAAGQRYNSLISSDCKTLFLLYEAPRKVLGPMQWVLKGLSLGLQELRHEDDHSPPSNAKIFHGVVLN